MEILTDDIWHLLISNTDAQEIRNKVLSYDFGELGILSQKDIVKTLVETFRAKKGRAGGSGKKTLVFNQAILDKLGKSYEIDIKINLKGKEEGQSRIGINRYLR